MGRIWWRWVAGGLLVFGAIAGWWRLRDGRARHVAARPAPAVVQSRPATASAPKRRPSRAPPHRFPVTWAAAVLVAAAIAAALTLPRSANAPRPAYPTRPAASIATRVAFPTAPSGTRVPARPPPTSVEPLATPADGAAPGPVATPVTLPMAPARPGDPVEAIRARGPLRGMGYNPTYATAGVPPAERGPRLRRDLRRMSAVGVNMVLGWEPGVFDEELLAAAGESGIGVILPFDLKPDWDYADPDLRARLVRQVSEWVVRFRDNPAVLMWGLGNEVTIESDDAGRRAFAAFYVELFDLVRALDPTRPVVLREAEDVFVPYLAEAFGRRPAISGDPDPTSTLTETPVATDEYPALPAPQDAPTPTPRMIVRAPEGFIYGANFYTDRVAAVLADWVKNTGLDAPVIVSEYAPAGVGRALRGPGYRRLYDLIASGGPRVLGSAPYTWTTAGPEAVDDYFGLVDADGQPVDDALAAVATMYGVEPPTWARTTEPRQQLANIADLPRLMRSAAVIAAAAGGLDEYDVRLAVEEQSAQAADELGVAPDAEDEGAARTRQVTELIGWARELSTLRDGSGRLFPGMHEALPLLNGMARWSRGEPSAVDTARGFIASVLRRDLAALGG